jgi:transposase
VFNGLRYVARTGAPWRWMPHDLPPWAAVYQQVQRAGWWRDASRLWPRIWARYCAWPRAQRAAERSQASCEAVPRTLDSRTLRSSPGSGTRAGYDGAKRKKGSKLHLAVDTLGHLLALHVMPASTDDRSASAILAQAVQTSTGQSAKLAHDDQGYTDQKAADDAKRQGIELEVVKLVEAKRGFVLLPRRRAVEHSFAWATRFRQLVKHYGRYASTLADLHLATSACPMLKQNAQPAAGP